MMTELRIVSDMLNEKTLVKLKNPHHNFDTGLI